MHEYCGSDSTNVSKRSASLKGLVAMLFTVSIVFIIIGTGSVSADFTFTGDKTIDNGQAYDITIIMPTAGPLPFTVDVYSGPNIDIILVDAANLQKWADDESYTYYRGGTFFDSNHAVGNAWLEAGTYHLIFDNEYKIFGGGPVTVHYSYTPTTVSSTSSGGSGNGGLLSGLMLILLLVAIVVIAVVAYLVIRQRGTEGKAMGQTGPAEPTQSASNQAGNDSRYCRYCGSLMSTDGAYCPKCGKQSDRGED
jgi:uncharacterized membrane protein